MIKLFTITFLSAFFLLIGVMTLTSMYWPILAAPFIQSLDYLPQLPLAEDRESGFFNFELERAEASQLYPALISIDDESTGDWIHIPSIGVRVPLKMSDSMTDDDVLAALDYGAALYPNGVSPGHLGNTFISAHSTGEPWKGLYRFAFLKINDLGAGNLIHLDWQGTRYTYRVSGSELIVPHPDLRIASDRPMPTLTVMACWPLWSTDKRMLVSAELTNITQLHPAAS